MNEHRVVKRPKNVHLPVQGTHSLHATRAEAEAELTRLRTLTDKWHYWIVEGAEPPLQQETAEPSVHPAAPPLRPEPVELPRTGGKSPKPISMDIWDDLGWDENHESQWPWVLIIAAFALFFGVPLVRVISSL